jgi:hypothetical protein
MKAIMYFSKSGTSTERPQLSIFRLIAPKSALEAQSAIRICLASSLHVPFALIAWLISVRRTENEASLKSP